TTTLHDWVEESTPATRAALMAALAFSLAPRAEKVLDGKLVETLVVVAAARGGVQVERVGGERVVRLARRERRHRELLDTRRRESLLHLRVGAEVPRPLLEDQVRPHVRRRRRPHARDVLRTGRFVVEVARTLVAAVLQQVDQEERALEVTMAEDQV